MFLPIAPDKVRTLDHTMRASLARSLEHIYSVTAAHLDCAVQDISTAVSEITAHRVKPEVFGRYFDLVFAVHGERYSYANVLLREIIDLVRHTPVFTVIPLTDEALGSDKGRYERIVNLDSSEQTIASPDPDRWRGFSDEIQSALELIGCADSALAAEIRELIVQIVGVSRPSEERASDLGGASSFMLWGAIFLYVLRHRTQLDLVEGLIHEAAHQLLFGLSVDEPLVENKIGDRYASPLRPDARPMDGVFHATFVCARICHGYSQLRRLDILQAHRLAMDRRLKDHRARFFAGLETVRRYGKLTRMGEDILLAANDYMRQV